MVSQNLKLLGKSVKGVGKDIHRDVGKTISSERKAIKRSGGMKGRVKTLVAKEKKAWRKQVG